MLASDRKIDYFLSELRRFSTSYVKGDGIVDSSSSNTHGNDSLNHRSSGKTAVPELTHSTGFSQEGRDGATSSDTETPETLKEACMLPGAQRFTFILSTTPLSLPKIDFKLSSIRKRIQTQQRLYNLSRSISTIVSGSALDSVGAELASFDSELRLLREAEKEYMDVISGSPESNDISSSIEVIAPAKVSGRLKFWMFRCLEIIPPKSTPNSRCDLYYVVRVDGVIKYTSSNSTSNRWNESSDIKLYKASVFEVSVYSGSSNSISSYGVLWFYLSDLIEYMQHISSPSISKPKLPDAMRTDILWLEMEPRSWALSSFEYRASYMHTSEGGACKTIPENIAGDAINASDGSAPAAPPKDLNASGKPLRRSRVVRPQFPKLGHTYLHKIIFGVMLCSVCEEKCRKSIYICEGCKNAVHPKCYNSVMWMCAAAQKDTDGHIADIYGSFKNYNIPHIIRYVTMLTPAFCNYCGIFMSPGRKILACRECKKHFHKSCIKFIPNFCGLTKRTAATIITALEEYEFKFHMDTIERAKRHKHLDTFFSGDVDAKAPLSASTNVTSRGGPVRSASADKLVPYTESFGVNLAKNIKSNSLGDTGPTCPALDSAGGPVKAFEAAPVKCAVTVPVEGAVSSVNDLDSTPVENFHENRSENNDCRKNRAKNMNQTHVKPALKISPKVAPENVKKSSSSGASVSDFVYKMLFNHQGTPKHGKRSKKHGKENVVKDLSYYIFLAVLGRGAFGTVYLVKEKESKKLYAVKALKKRAILKNGDMKSLQVERNVFIEILSSRLPYLVSLDSMFQSEDYVFFVMEYISGGDLMTLIMKKKRFPIEWVKFYSCELLLVIEYFHSRNIIYRDLKLDNILLCSDGHIKVTDYGICKENIGYGQKTATFCGTPDYMAPEVLMSRQYDRSVDWWSFGILLYVMIAGRYPFRGEGNRGILKSIISNDVYYPNSFTPDLISLVKGLLETDSQVRLGSGPNGADEVKSHPFYKDVDWSAFYSRLVRPPWKPIISSPDDVNNFDTEFTSEVPILSGATVALSPQEQKEFSSFTSTTIA